MPAIFWKYTKLSLLLQPKVDSSIASKVSPGMSISGRIQSATQFSVERTWVSVTILGSATVRYHIWFCFGRTLIGFWLLTQLIVCPVTSYGLKQIFITFLDIKLEIHLQIWEFVWRIWNLKKREMVSGLGNLYPKHVGWCPCCYLSSGRITSSLPRIYVVEKKRRLGIIELIKLIAIELSLSRFNLINSSLKRFWFYS